MNEVSEMVKQNLAIMDHQYDLQLALLNHAAFQASWVLVLVITIALAVAICNVVFWEWVIKSKSNSFGGNADEATPESKIIFYSALIGCTVFGALICAGLVAHGVFMASVS